MEVLLPFQTSSKMAWNPFFGKCQDNIKWIDQTRSLSVNTGTTTIDRLKNQMARGQFLRTLAIVIINLRRRRQHTLLVWIHTIWQNIVSTIWHSILLSNQPNLLYSMILESEQRNSKWSILHYTVSLRDLTRHIKCTELHLNVSGAWWMQARAMP